MHHPFDRKLVAITPPALLANTTSPGTTTIDTIGYDYVVINLFLGATDIALTAAKIQESDDSGMSGAADIVGTRMGTDANDTGSTSTLPTATDDNHLFSWFIDMRGRKRYLDLVYTIGTGVSGAYSAAWAELWRAKDSPETAAKAGYTQRMVV